MKYFKRIIALLAIGLVAMAFLTSCANPDIEKIPPEEMPEKAVMVDDVLYYYTGQHVELLRCGVMDGEITKSVSASTLPGENDESNFGKGYEYQRWGEHHLDIIMPEEDNAWIRFCDGLCSDDHSRPLTEASFNVPVDETGEELCSLPLQTGDCIETEDGSCIPTDGEYGELCICGYPTQADIKTYPGHIAIMDEHTTAEALS